MEWEENGFTGRRCECGLLYISPRPEWSEILEGYKSKEADSRAHFRIGSEILGRLNAQQRLGVLKRYVKKGDLLEIGPGSGYFLDESRRMGFQPFGVEIDLQKVGFIREYHQIPVESEPFSDSSFQGKSFDVICHFDVVSHFYDPISEFKRFYDRLKDGGILFFETGNGGDLSQGWLRYIGRLQYPQHLYLFSSKNIERLCEETGFEIVKIYSYSIILHLASLKVFQGLRRLFGKSGTREKEEGGPTFLEPPGSHSAIRRRLIQGAIRGNLFLRYGIGRIFPKVGPQTILYVARKRAPLTGDKPWMRKE